jgi:hypothetical protein
METRFTLAHQPHLPSHLTNDRRSRQKNADIFLFVVITAAEESEASPSLNMEAPTSNPMKVDVTG